MTPDRFDKEARDLSRIRSFGEQANAIAAALRAVWDEAIEAAAGQSCAHCRDRRPVQWNATWQCCMHKDPNCPGELQCYATRIRSLKSTPPPADGGA